VRHLVYVRGGQSDAIRAKPVIFWAGRFLVAQDRSGMLHISMRFGGRPQKTKTKKSEMQTRTNMVVVDVDVLPIIGTLSNGWNEI